MFYSAAGAPEMSARQTANQRNSWKLKASQMMCKTTIGIIKPKFRQGFGRKLLITHHLVADCLVFCVHVNRPVGPMLSILYKILDPSEKEFQKESKSNRFNHINLFSLRNLGLGNQPFGSTFWSALFQELQTERAHPLQFMIELRPGFLGRQAIKKIGQLDAVTHDCVCGAVAKVLSDVEAVVRVIKALNGLRHAQHPTGQRLHEAQVQQCKQLDLLAEPAARLGEKNPEWIFASHRILTLEKNLTPATLEDACSK